MEKAEALKAITAYGWVIKEHGAGQRLGSCADIYAELSIEESTYVMVIDDGNVSPFPALYHLYFMGDNKEFLGNKWGEFRVRDVRQFTALMDLADIKCKHVYGAKYVKKPVVVDAIQYLSDDNLPDIEAWVKSFGADYSQLFSVKEGFFGVRTLEDRNYNFHAIRQFDYIVRGVDGEFYPCFAPIFEKLHEKVEAQ